MERHQATVLFNDPKTKEKIERVYKYAPYETDGEAVLTVSRALNFLYGESVRFHIDFEEDINERKKENKAISIGSGAK